MNQPYDQPRPEGLLGFMHLDGIKNIKHLTSPGNKVEVGFSVLVIIFEFLRSFVIL